jgi:hypothetical protein
MLPIKQLVIGATTFIYASYTNTSVHPAKSTGRTAQVADEQYPFQRRRLPGSFWALQYVAATGRPKP